MCGMFLIAGCNKDKSEEIQMDMLNIENLRISDEQLNFEYEMENTLAHDIWICDDIYMYYDLKVEIKVEKKQLLIILKSFDVPPGILFEAPILTKYIRLKPNEIYRGSICLILPIKSKSPISEGDSDRDAKIVKEIKQIVFEIGFYEEDLSIKISDSIEKSDSDDVVYIGHLWEERNKEKSSKVSITGIAVPCYM